MSENIASIRTLLPLLFFHSIVYAIFISAILIYFLTQQEWSQRAYAIFLESKLRIVRFNSLFLAKKKHRNVYIKTGSNFACM